MYKFSYPNTTVTNIPKVGHRTNREEQKHREGNETRDNNRRKAMSDSIGK